MTEAGQSAVPEPAPQPAPGAGEVAAAAGTSRPGDRFLLVVDVRTAGSVLAALLAAFLLFAVFRDTGETMTRIGIGVVLALALDGLVGHLRQRFGISRGPAVALVAGGLFVLALLVVVVLGPPAVHQARDFATHLPETVRGLYDLPLVGPRLESADAVAKVQQFVDDLPARLDAGTVTTLAERLANGLVTVAVVVGTTFAVLFDGERLVNLARRALPASARPQADRAGRIFARVVGRYFGGSLTLAVLMGLWVLSISLVFGVPLAPLAAVWAMITDLIPQVGGFLGGAFLAVLALSRGPGTAVLAVLAFVVYLTFDNHVLQPAVIGKAVDLTPPTTMLAALVGSAAFGVPGALVATPFVGALKQLFFELRDPEWSPPPAASGSPIARVKALLHRRRRRPPAEAAPGQVAAPVTEAAGEELRP